LAIVFTVLTSFWACNPGKPWWRKRDIVTDLCYWFFIPVIARYLRIGLLVLGAAVLFNITTADGLVAFYDNGHGPLAALPLVVQMVLFLVGEDIILYWTHRLFHGRRMWRYHAIHHSSEELEWISAARFHPVNLFLGTVAVDVILLLAGLLLASIGPALAQDPGTLDQKPLPPLDHPSSLSTPAKELFARKTEPLAGPARSIGFYSTGCLAGGVALPVDGPTWQVMRLSRNRNWGNPALTTFLERFAAHLLSFGLRQEVVADEGARSTWIRGRSEWQE